MSNVANISSAARMVSSQQMAETGEAVGIKVLKKQMQTEEQMQQMLVQMMQQLSPHLGGNVNVLA